MYVIEVYLNVPGVGSMLTETHALGEDKCEALTSIKVQRVVDSVSARYKYEATYAFKHKISEA